MPRSASRSASRSGWGVRDRFICSLVSGVLRDRFICSLVSGVLRLATCGLHRLAGPSNCSRSSQNGRDGLDSAAASPGQRTHGLSRRGGGRDVLMTAYPSPTYKDAEDHGGRDEAKRLAYGNADLTCPLFTLQ